MPSNGEPARMAQLDGIRAFAVFAVLFQHYWLSRTLFFGDLGVQCFFVLSGYLITGILLRSRGAVAEGESSTWMALGRFYARRFLRIFPAYYMVIGLVALTALERNRGTFKWHLTYLTSVFLAVNPAPNASTLTHFWTLSVEEQFYVLWPCWILLAPRRWLIPGTLGIIILSPTYKLVAGWAGVNFNARTLTIVGNTEALGMGALLALAETGPTVNKGLRAVLRPVGFWLGGLLLAPSLGIAMDTIPHDDLLWVYGNFGMALLFSWLISGAAQGFSGVVGRVLGSRPLTYLGTISYGIYLIHVPLVEFCVQRLPPGSSLARPGAAQFLVFSVLTVGAAALSWHLYEKPINRLKRHFPYGRREQ